MFIDPELKEVYKYGENESNLVYWFCWNIDKSISDIPDLNKNDVLSNHLSTLNSDLAILSQIYPYKIFDINTLQLYRFDNNRIRLNHKQEIDREVKLIPKILCLTEQENTKLNDIYKEHKNNLPKFYEEFMVVVSNIEEREVNHSIKSMDICPSITDCSSNTECPSMSFNCDDIINIKYSLPNNLVSDYTFFSEQEEIYKKNLLRVFSYDDIVYDFSDIDEMDKYEKMIELPKKTYWELKFNKFDTINNGKILIKINNHRCSLITKDKNYYRLPYMTNNFKLELELLDFQQDKFGKFMMIKESKYITKPLIWNNIIKLPNNKYFDGVSILNSNLANINLNLPENTKFNLDYLFSPISTDNQIDNNRLENKRNLNFEMNNILNEIKLFNGSITFFQIDSNLSDIENEYNYDIKPKRINKKILENISCYSDNIVGNQILPSLKINLDENLLGENENDIMGAIEVYYITKDSEGNDKKNIVYLEWDIDFRDKKTLDINYTLFKNNVKVNLLESSIAPVPAPPDYSDLNDIYSFRDKYLIDKNDYLMNVNKEMGKNCKKKKYYNSVDLNNGIKLQINVDENENSLLQNFKDINMIFNDNNNLFENRAFKLIYNQEIKKWQLWEDVEYSPKNNNVNSENYIWIANQMYNDYIFQEGKTKWIFSPNYRRIDDKVDFDFFEFPNWYNKNKDIKGTSLNKARIQEISIKPLNAENKVDVRDCSRDYSNKIELRNEFNSNTNKLPDKLGDENYEPRYFRNTLFNLPNISEVDVQGDLIMLEDPDIDDNKVPTISGPKLYYNLPLRIKVHLYHNKKIDSSSGEINHIEKRFSDFMANIVRESVENQNIVKRYDRYLSELVKTNYINFDLIQEIRNENNKMRFNYNYREKENNAKFRHLDEALNEVLLYKGDLTKNNYYYSDKYIKMEEKVFVGRKQAIIDRKGISNDIINNFNEYISNRKVLLKNYSSYGNINLLQNETEIIYKIPTDIQCMEKKLTNSNLSKYSEEEIKKKLILLKVYINGKNLKYWFTKHKSFIQKYFNELVVIDSYRHLFNDSELDVIGNNIILGYQKFNQYKKDYYSTNKTNNKIKAILNIFERIIYLVNFDKGETIKITNDSIDFDINPAPTPGPSPCPSSSSCPNKTLTEEQILQKEEMIKNTKTYLMYKEFYLLHKVYELSVEFIRDFSHINGGDTLLNLFKRIETKMLEINKRFELRHNEIFSYTQIEEVEVEIEQPKQRETKRSEMTPQEAVHHYKNMIFDIFD